MAAVQNRAEADHSAHAIKHGSQDSTVHSQSLLIRHRQLKSRGKENGHPGSGK